MKKLLILSGIFIILFGKGFTTMAQSFVPDEGEAGISVKNAVEEKAYAFDLKDVRLLNSPFKSSMETDTKYLLELKPDRFLAHFRTHAGLAAKDSVYGGWESSGLAGHSLGHYMSACSMAYASTGNPEFLKRTNYIVSELALCQQKRGSGYIGAIPNEDSIFGEVAEGHIKSGGFDLNGGWSPWYTVHKIMAGLLDVYIYCHNKEALEVQKKFADWAGNTIKNLDEQQMQKMLICEYGGMNEVLANTYAITGNKKYLDLAYRFYDKKVLDPLGQQVDDLAGKHSNTQIPKILGCARIYELTGDDHMDKIENFFWDAVTGHHSYAPGGNGNYEYFGPADKLNDQLSDNTMETCPTYNMLKLTNHLFTLHPSAHLMDYYEKALYNHILATEDHQTDITKDGDVPDRNVYFTSLRMGSKKLYQSPYEDFTCCIGTGMENPVKYGESIYFHDRDGSLYVNLFIPSILNWKEKGIIVRQETLLPKDDKVDLTITAKKPTQFSVHIRKPYWAFKGVQVKVNEKIQLVSADSDGYITLNRTWKDKDHIELIMPMNIHTEAMPDNADRMAVFYGPVLLAGELGNTEPDPITGVPVFVTTSTSADQWIKKDNASSLVFHSVNVGMPENVEMIPFNQTGNEYYTVYWDVFTPAKWAVRQKEYEEEKKREQEMEARTIDILRVGEMQPERDHDFKGEKIYTGESHNKKWRAAGEGGYFSFKMKVDPDAANDLICAYWGMDNRDRIFDILVDGVKVATENLNKFKENKFYYMTYPVPGELTQNKQQVTVTFKAVGNNNVGPVYEIRMVKEDKK